MMTDGSVPKRNGSATVCRRKVTEPAGCICCACRGVEVAKMLPTYAVLSATSPSTSTMRSPGLTLSTVSVSPDEMPSRAPRRARFESSRPTSKLLLGSDQITVTEALITLVSAKPDEATRVIAVRSHPASGEQTSAGGPNGSGLPVSGGPAQVAAGPPTLIVL